MLHCRKMILQILLCVTVFIRTTTCGRILQEGDPDNRLKALCNRDIPEDRSVEVGGECRTSQNCQQVDTECVYMRDNYCECQVAEERITKRRRNRLKKLCRKRDGHSCSRRSRCEKKYRKRRKTCRNPGHVCCTKCKNIEKYKCMPEKSCAEGSVMTLYQCFLRNNVCCIKGCESGALYDYCDVGRCDCNDTNAECVSERCLCMAGYEDVGGVCKPVCQSGALTEYCDPGRCDCTDPNAECASDTCQCISGYTDVSGVCKPVCQSGAITEYCDAGRCDCTDANAECSSGTCQCMSGYTDVSGVCKSLTCDSGWDTYGNSCYKKSPSTGDFTTVEGVCNGLHDDCHLASVHSDGEHSFLKGQYTPLSENTIWIGLSDPGLGSLPRAWEWTDGTPYDYTGGYASGEPNDASGSEDCIELHGSLGYDWNDGACSTVTYGICKYYLPVV